jgi:hypothetical protein
MKGLIIFISSVIAFICLSFWAFWDMETDMEIAGMLFTGMFAFAFLVALLSFIFDIKVERIKKFF